MLDEDTARRYNESIEELESECQTYGTFAKYAGIAAGGGISLVLTFLLGLTILPIVGTFATIGSLTIGSGALGRYIEYKKKKKELIEYYNTYIVPEIKNNKTEEQNTSKESVTLDEPKQRELTEEDKQRFEEIRRLKLQKYTNITNKLKSNKHLKIDKKVKTYEVQTQEKFATCLGASKFVVQSDSPENAIKDIFKKVGINVNLKRLTDYTPGNSEPADIMTRLIVKKTKTQYKVDLYYKVISMAKEA